MSGVMPAVAAVTINFGPPDDTLECVQSLVATGYDPLRIIVVDNGSARDHLTRLKACLPSGVEVIESATNLGFAGGNNLGIRRALAQGAAYVLLINNDATLNSDAIQNMVSTAAKLPRLGVLGGKILIVDEQGATDRIWGAGGRWAPWKAQAYTVGMAETDRGQYDHAAPQEFLPATMWLMPAGVLRDVGELPEEFFLYAEDLDYCLELTKHGYLIMYDPSAVCFHKVSRSHWENRDRASPVLNYYTNRNRMLIARKWLSPVQRALFYVYMLSSRTLLAVLRRDRSYWAGLWDGVRGRTGPKPG